MLITCKNSRDMNARIKIEFQTVNGIITLDICNAIGIGITRSETVTCGPSHEVLTAADRYADAYLGP